MMSFFKVFKACISMQNLNWPFMKIIGTRQDQINWNLESYFYFIKKAYPFQNISIRLGKSALNFCTFGFTKEF